METMKVLKELGANFGILLSEKDSIVYPQTLAPELRAISNRRKQVHHVPDYIGATPVSYTHLTLPTTPYL